MAGTPTVSHVQLGVQFPGGAFVPAGESITVGFAPSETLNEPVVHFFSGGTEMTNSASNISYSFDPSGYASSNLGTGGWFATIVVHGDDVPGEVSFTIDFTDLGGTAGSTVTEVEDPVNNIYYVDHGWLTSSSLSPSSTVVAAGSTVTLSFQVAVAVVMPSGDDVRFLSSGVAMANNNSVTYSTSSPGQFAASIVVSASDANGYVSFELDLEIFDGPLAGRRTGLQLGGGGGSDPNVSGNPPQLVDITLGPSLAVIPGDTVTLTFKVVSNEQIQAPAGNDVVFKSGGGPLGGGVAMANNGAITYSTPAPLTYAASIVVSASDTTGVISFTIDFASSTGGAGTTVVGNSTNPDLYVDTTPPTLSPVLLSVVDAGGNVVSRTNASAADSIRLTFTASEAIMTPVYSNAGRRVVFGSGGAPAMANNSTVTYAQEGDASLNKWSATIAVDSGDTEGAVSFAINFYDANGVAGNAVGATTDGSALSVIHDNTVPQLSSVLLGPDIGIVWTSDNDLTLSFTADEEIQTPAGNDVVFKSGGVAMENNNAITYAQDGDASLNKWTAVITVHDNDTTGEVSFALDFADTAGNAGTTVVGTTGGNALYVDNTHPTLSSVLLTVNGSLVGSGVTAFTGDNIKLAFTASEAIMTPQYSSSGRRIVFQSGGSDMANNSTATYAQEGDASLNKWSATIVVDGGDTDGVVSFTINFSDANGNAGSPVAGTMQSLNVDTSVYASGVGDPHIQPVFGDLFELPTTADCFRMLQGEDLVVNALTRPTTKEERTNMLAFTRAVGRTPLRGLKVDGVFFGKLFIASEGRTLVLDYDAHSCNMSDGQYFTITPETQSGVCTPYGDKYQKALGGVYIAKIGFTHLQYGKLEIHASFSSNPWLKHGLTGKLPVSAVEQSLTGLFIREYQCKSMRVNKLTSQRKKTGIVKRNRAKTVLQQNMV